MSIKVTSPAPSFKANAVVNGQIQEISLDDYKGKWVVLFFWPLDFTFVCPTEIIANSLFLPSAIRMEMFCSGNRVYSMKRLPTGMSWQPRKSIRIASPSVVAILFRSCLYFSFSSR